MGLPAAEVENRVDEALEMVGMTAMAEKQCHLLSGGEKRRVAIAGVLAMRSRILVFDEPFVNLDYRGVQQVLRQVVQLHREGHTILLTTHDVEKVIAHVDRIAIVYKGELKASGAPDAVIPLLEGYQVRPPCTSLPPQRALSWLPD
jgi:biotin transport system ATP-binding protein